MTVDLQQRRESVCLDVKNTRATHPAATLALLSVLRQQKAKAVFHRNVSNGRMTRSVNVKAALRDVRMQLPKVSVLGSANHSQET